MSSVAIRIGATATAVATATSTDPNTTLPAATFKYASSDTSLATVDEDTGIIKAVAVGSVLISATTTINGVDGTGSAGLDVQAQPGFTVSVVITPN